jgi:hypothetical protein
MENKLNKRGRKPKQDIVPILKKESINLDVPIIVHLPICYSEIITSDIDDLFIKADTSIQYNEKEIYLLKKKIEELTNKLNKYESTKKPSVYQLSNSKSKCWWCRYNYELPTVELPEHYFNEKFHSIGFFCSYNCAMAYNIDINDENISKRNSLLYLHYRKTYNEDIILKPSPSWKILKDNGGTITIEEFRTNLILNKNNYLYIKPPIMSRISYVEIQPINVEKEIVKSSDLILKRSKPLNSTKYTLESTMGLKKIVNKNI